MIVEQEKLYSKSYWHWASGPRGIRPSRLEFSVDPAGWKPAGRTGWKPAPQYDKVELNWAKLAENERRIYRIDRRKLSLGVFD
jgi:hypothetical protein